MIFKLQKIKDEEKILKDIRGGKKPYRERNKDKNHETSLKKPCKQEESGVKYLKVERKNLPT